MKEEKSQYKMKEREEEKIKEKKEQASEVDK